MAYKETNNLKKGFLIHYFLKYSFSVEAMISELGVNTHAHTKHTLFSQLHT